MAAGGATGAALSPFIACLASPPALPGPGRAASRQGAQGGSRTPVPRPGCISGCRRAQRPVYVPMETLLCCCFPSQTRSQLGGSQQLRIPHSFHQQLRGASLPRPPPAQQPHPPARSSPSPAGRAGGPAALPASSAPSFDRHRAFTCPTGPCEGAASPTTPQPLPAPAHPSTCPGLGPAPYDHRPRRGAELSLPRRRWTFKVETPPGAFPQPGRKFSSRQRQLEPKESLDISEEGFKQSRVAVAMAAAGPPAPSRGWGHSQGGGSSSPVPAVPGLPGRRRAVGHVLQPQPCPCTEAGGSRCQALPVLSLGGPCLGWAEGAGTRADPIPHPPWGQPSPAPHPATPAWARAALAPAFAASGKAPAAIVVTAGHGHADGTSQEVPVGAPGCRLPAALGVFARHSAESSDDPGRAAVGRCQTPALEHPLASHQPWPRPRRRSRQRQCRTHGWGWGSWTWDPASAGLGLLLPVRPCPPAPSPPVHDAGGPKGHHKPGGLRLSHSSRGPSAESSSSLHQPGWGRRAEAAPCWARTGRAAGRGHSWSRCSLEGPKGPISAFNEWEWERALYCNSSNYIVRPWQPTPVGVQRHGITISHLAWRLGSAPCRRAASQGRAIKGCRARCEVR